ncbi:MAG: GlxA family transcriptional regulator [Methylobacteriaceae bacterium]|nr:GlxA family transcriptional regulator [Methylobacteriaceae bacterium]
MRNRPTDASPRPRLEVGFVLANHFTLTAFANFVDTLRLAADEGDRSRQILCRWTTMSATGAPVSASCGVAVTPQSRFVDPRRFHYIVVVGGLLHAGPQIDAATGAYLARAAEAGVALVGVCTGSFVLARLGLLTGRKICVSWFHRQDFVDAFGGPAPIADRLYVIDGDRITCSGGAGVVDLAAALVERHVGARAARKSLDVLLLDGPRAADAAQPTPAFAQDVSDVRVRRAILLMEQTLAHPAPVAEIARKVGLSERQLDRLFRAELGESPAQTHRRMRGDYGRWLLVNTDRSVFEIATMAGFVDGAHFAREMRRRHGASPTALRAGGARAPAPDAAAGRLFR